jgi:SNF2 family DNA or RNA helicase
MLISKYLKVYLSPTENGNYFLTAEGVDGRGVPASKWKHLLFFSHEDSYYGTTIDTSVVDGVEGVVLDGWQLVTLLAKEPFNRFIEWDWDDLAHVCMMAAPALYEAVKEKDWMPDFAAWERDGTFRWALPGRVLSEFGPGFWAQKVVLAKGKAEIVEDDVHALAEDYGGEIDATHGAVAGDDRARGAVAGDDRARGVVAGDDRARGVVAGDDRARGMVDGADGSHGEAAGAVDEVTGAGICISFSNMKKSRTGAVDEVTGAAAKCAANTAKVTDAPTKGVTEETAFSAAKGEAGRSQPLLHFISDWFNHALDAFLKQDEMLVALFGEKLGHLRELGVSAKTLAQFFNEESWLRWIGLKEDSAPFTIGLQLEEPTEADGDWSLHVFLRGKIEPYADHLYRLDGIDQEAMPLEWLPFLDRVAEEEARWVALFPWLAAGDASDGRAAPRSTTEFEASMLQDTDIFQPARRIADHLTKTETSMSPDTKISQPTVRIADHLTKTEASMSPDTKISQPSVRIADHLTETEASMSPDTKISQPSVRIADHLAKTEASMSPDTKISQPSVRIADHLTKTEAPTPHSTKISPPTRRLTNRLTEYEAWEFLTEASETLVALGVEILLPGWWQAMKHANLKVKARVKTGAGRRGRSFVGLEQLLDYDWRFSMNGVELSEEEFRRLVEEKRRLVFVRGRWIKLDPQFIRQIQDLLKKAEKEGLHVRDLLEQELLAAEAGIEDDELENPKAFARIQIELNRQWKQLVQQLSELKKIPLVPVPAGFHGELRPYQQFGMSWLWFLRQAGFGACLADDMGLGKTVQLLSYLLLVKEKEASGPALIICPTSVLGNWQKEIERFAPELRVYLHYGANRLKSEAFAARATEADIVLSSYGLSHLDFDEFASVTWSSIAIDEAQNIKNAGTKQSRAVRKLRGRHHIALTGTPMENRLTELWSIFDFINHGYLGSLTKFQKRFVAPIEKDGANEKIGQLQALIRPFLLRRTKKDEEVALNLPDKLEQKEYCPLTAEQASLYEQLVRDTFAEIEKLTGFERKGLILSMLGRLKQLCNHPALYLKESEPRRVLERSAKMEKLVELVEAVLAGDESCLIFTQYIEMGLMIQGVLRERFGVDVPFLNGSVPKQQRDAMILRFQEREFPVFLLSLKAGGTGLNLTAANHVIHYDRWWNPAVENQATDRAYRIGQKRFVHVHKLIATGTLEEKIDAMIEKKQMLNEQIIQSENWITELSTDELQELLTLTH